MSELVNLTREQREAIAEIDHNLQIIACAGSGKTEVITRRIAHILEEKPETSPRSIVAFTFTNKAADSMKARIEKLLGARYGAELESMYIGTIHGFCIRLLQKYAKQFQSYQVLDPVKAHLFLRRYSKDCGMEDLGLQPGTYTCDLFLACIEKMIADHDHAAEWTETQRTVLQKYKACLYSRMCIDFSLLIFEALQQMQSDPRVQEYLSTIRYLVVDEYQDVDDLQEKLIYHIAQAGANICAVGDDDQTIYQFRGSNAENMITFAKRYPDVHQVHLAVNFRCTPGIVDIAEHVIRNNEHRLPKKMLSGVSEQTGEALASGYENEQEAYAAIAAQIQALHANGIPYHEIAVLLRKRRYIRPIAQVLEQSGIPCENDDIGDFFASESFQSLCAAIKVLEDVDKKALYEHWKDLADPADLNTGFRYLRSCTRGGTWKLSEIILEFCARVKFLETDDPERKTALARFTQILDDYDAVYGDWQPSARVHGVLFFLEEQAADEYRYYHMERYSDRQDAVQLMTIHKAKGLEFNTVFIPELLEGEFPAANRAGRKYWHVLGGTFAENKEKYMGDEAEERKLFYVAVTRARENLYLSYTGQKQKMSRFVKEASESVCLSLK